MRILPSAVALMLASLPLAVAAQQKPVVLELFTSQGCSSCPKADELFAKLGQEQGVIALALHVDYWDYLGWKDSFAQPAYTSRQRAYARAMRQRSLFTPQMIVQGEDLLIGHDAATIGARIAVHAAEPDPVDLQLRREDGKLHVKLTPRDPGTIGGTDVELVRFKPADEVAIERGENAGRDITYTNIVTDWSTIGHWDGTAESEITVDDASQDPVAVIVQRERLGPILSAAKLP